MKVIKVLAPAKINLFLDIINYEESGFHNIITVFQAIKLFDEIKISESRTNKIYVRPKGIIKGKNIVSKVFKYSIPLPSKIKIVIKKNIPVGAGLGGGSSDAAAVVLAIKKLFNINFSEKEILKNIGADCSFFISGGIQIGTHYGEVLKKIKIKFNYPIILIYPGFPVLTKEIYNSVDPKYFKKGLKKFEKIKQAIKQKKVDILIENLYNIFEYILFKRYVEIKEMKDEILKKGALNALVSGTGSTVYGIYEQNRVEKAYKELKEKYKNVILTTSYNRGVTII